MSEDDGLLASLGLGRGKGTHVDHPAILGRPGVVLERHLGDPGGQWVGVFRGGGDVGFEVCSEKGDPSGLHARAVSMLDERPARGGGLT